jgi:hypothetical protein
VPRSGQTAHRGGSLHGAPHAGCRVLAVRPPPAAMLPVSFCRKPYRLPPNFQPRLRLPPPHSSALGLLLPRCWCLAGRAGRRLLRIGYRRSCGFLVIKLHCAAVPKSHGSVDSAGRPTAVRDLILAPRRRSLWTASSADTARCGLITLAHPASAGATPWPCAPAPACAGPPSGPPTTSPHGLLARAGFHRGSRWVWPAPLRPPGAWPGCSREAHPPRGAGYTTATRSRARVPDCAGRRRRASVGAEPDARLLILLAGSAAGAGRSARQPGFPGEPLPAALHSASHTAKVKLEGGHAAAQTTGLYLYGSAARFSSLRGTVIRPDHVFFLADHDAVTSSTASWEGKPRSAVRLLKQRNRKPPAK